MFPNLVASSVANLLPPNATLNPAVAASRKREHEIEEIKPDIYGKVQRGKAFFLHFFFAGILHFTLKKIRFFFFVYFIYFILYFFFFCFLFFLPFFFSSSYFWCSSAALFSLQQQLLLNVKKLFGTQTTKGFFFPLPFFFPSPSSLLVLDSASFWSLTCIYELCDLLLFCLKEINTITQRLVVEDWKNKTRQKKSTFFATNCLSSG